MTRREEIDCLRSSLAMLQSHVDDLTKILGQRERLLGAIIHQFGGEIRVQAKSLIEVSPTDRIEAERKVIDNLLILKISKEEIV